MITMWNHNFDTSLFYLTFKIAKFILCLFSIKNSVKEVKFDKGKILLQLKN